MAKEEVVFRMFPDGKRELEVNGVVGAVCETKTANMLKELGRKGVMKKKPVYHQKNTQTNTQTQF